MVVACLLSQHEVLATIRACRRAEVVPVPRVSLTIRVRRDQVLCPPTIVPAVSAPVVAAAEDASQVTLGGKRGREDGDGVDDGQADMAAQDGEKDTKKARTEVGDERRVMWVALPMVTHACAESTVTVPLS